MEPREGPGGEEWPWDFHKRRTSNNQMPSLKRGRRGLHPCVPDPSGLPGGSGSQPQWLLERESPEVFRTMKNPIPAFQSRLCHKPLMILLSPFSESQFCHLSPSLPHEDLRITRKGTFHGIKFCRGGWQGGESLGVRRSCIQKLALLLRHLLTEPIEQVSMPF